MDAAVLAGWDNFYVIVGSAAAGLTGITFVVIALIRDQRSVRPTGVRAYLSPTIVHFGGVLALSAYLSMPHQRLLTLSVGFIAGGLAGIIYGLFTAVNLRRQSHGGDYVPVREDWVWNVILPTFVYAGLTLAGLFIWRETPQVLFAVALLSLLLLFIGIRNSWDIAVWMTTHPPERRD
jgi:energy-converting hydrogenase Eha subunit A